MIKEPPSLGRMIAMVVFALSCFGLLIFLWLSFGGPIPLKPKAYRLTADVPEAATLAQESDVRMSGITIGKVKTKAINKGGLATRVTLDIDPEYAPVPKDAKFMLRQKTLLGETYVELTPGNPKRGYLADGSVIPTRSIEPTVELDEIFSAFDKPTRTAFQQWVKESANAIRGRRDNPDSTAEDLNNALGNLGPFASDAADVLTVLDRQEGNLQRLIRNTGEVFGAISEREGALRSLIVNSDRVFDATSKRDAALREIFLIFPTFLDESKATLARLQTFSNNTRPLISDLRPVARKLDPTVKDLADLSPDLRQLFRDLDPLIDVSRENLPDAARFLRGATPVLEGLHNFLQEFNPVLSYMNYDARAITGFLSNGAATTNYRFKTDTRGNFIKALSQFGIINERSVSLGQSNSYGSKRPTFDRGTAYPMPENYLTAGSVGAIRTFGSCDHTGGVQKEPSEGEPPCNVQSPSLWDGKMFPRLERGKAPNEPGPQDPGASEQAQPNHYK